MTSKARQLAQSASAPEGRKNVVTNGAMQVAQRRTSETGIGVSDIRATIDGLPITVPLDPTNRHYAEILRQVEASTLTVEDAD